MKVSAQYVKDRAEAEHLDRLIATAKGYGAAGGGIIARGNSAEEVQEILDTLPGQVQGEFVVKVWKNTANKGRKGLAEIAYTFILDGTMGTNGVQGIAGGAPSWRELMDLKLQILKMEMENKYEGKKDDTLTQLAPLISGIVSRLGASGPAPAPAAPVSSPDPAPKADRGEDAELREILADVARFYRKNPDQARQFAPTLKQMANGTSGSA